ncbi:hypothetical protein [Enterococcus haemoperoxidus]|uniref:hypothetical protein n=1 Tax=Enterococcus haemoperoxidus TaxID=155618 RepID=UPI0003A270EA|nr:hypothetical protein [Enterococcus haemoperoxidus]OJG53998.1 hypothetical protein RV06_GL000391 [Enterococcus haemoperoxidus]
MKPYKRAENSLNELKKLPTVDNLSATYAVEDKQLIRVKFYTIFKYIIKNRKNTKNQQLLL